MTNLGAIEIIRSSILTSSMGRQIMVIDDDNDVVYIVRKHLEKWGYDVDTFTNPIGALEAFQAHPDRYDIVMTDIRMPEIDGIRLAQKMLKLKPSLRIIIMTAFEIYARDLSLSLPELNNDQVLRKPLDAATTCAAVKKQLGTHA